MPMPMPIARLRERERKKDKDIRKNSRVIKPFITVIILVLCATDTQSPWIWLFQSNATVALALLFTGKPIIFNRIVPVFSLHRPYMTFAIDIIVLITLLITTKMSNNNNSNETGNAALKWETSLLNFIFKRKCRLENFFSAFAHISNESFAYLTAFWSGEWE